MDSVRQHKTDQSTHSAVRQHKTDQSTHSAQASNKYLPIMLVAPITYTWFLSPQPSNNGSIWLVNDLVTLLCITHAYWLYEQPLVKTIYCYTKSWDNLVKKLTKTHCAANGTQLENLSTVFLWKKPSRKDAQINNLLSITLTSTQELFHHDETFIRKQQFQP